MKRVSLFSSLIAIIICLLSATSCEIDNYDAPDATIQGTLYDHHGQPLQVVHGREYIRIRDISWGKNDETRYTANRNLRVQQDGTYIHTKQFAGEYRLLPYQGNFFPFWDADDTVRDGDDGGILVNISGVTTQNFTVIPFLTIEWVEDPKVVMVEGRPYIECTVRFTRNQKEGYAQPNLRDARLFVSRTVNPSAMVSELFPTDVAITNAQEGQDITFRTARDLRYTGINYWVRVTMRCSNPAGTTYPNMDNANNCTTIKQIFVP